MENPIKMDDLGVPLFLEPPICALSYWLFCFFQVPCYFSGCLAGGVKDLFKCFTLKLGGRSQFDEYVFNTGLKLEARYCSLIVVFRKLLLPIGYVF